MFCGTDHKGECCARHCSSCTADWLSDTPGDGDDGRIKQETCPDCIADGFGTAEETLAFLEAEGNRIAAEVSAEYSARFKREADQVIANLEVRLREIDDSRKQAA